VTSTYEVIYADPPWRYHNDTPGREIERHYPTMTQEEICALNVPVARDAVLFLWAVSPQLPAALEVMAAWGFQYRSSAVWDKELVGMGYWFRGQHEHLPVGVRGKWSPPPQPLRVSSVYREPRGRHSKKPDAIRNMIAAWWPDARRLEMFCRYPSPGWAAWGNQVDTSVADLNAEKFDPTTLRNVPGQGALTFGDDAA
jgi:N6-adenosine-specific RNA methylase IME4